MAKPRMNVTAFVSKLLKEDDADVLKEGVQVLSQALMEAECRPRSGRSRTSAALTEPPTATATGPRRGTRASARSSSRSLRSLRGDFPSLLEPRRRAEKALHAVVVEAYVKGVSTRKVDDLVKALGIDGISRSEVSRIRKALDQEVEAFRSRASTTSAPTSSSMLPSTRSESSTAWCRRPASWRSA
jgi:putative transposase